ncbi:MAG: RluA family pseudouridine synthase, partial [Synergistaceae bacterium]|nr:RluA family pseudouridine synthase [Synergistaceae bacterium]
MQFHSMIVTEEISGHRLDFAVSRELGISRTYACGLIRDGRVGASDGRRVKPSMKVGTGEEFSIDVPPPEKLDL